MEELKPEELEELVQELEEESEQEEALSPEVEELLHVLQSGSAVLERRDAAEQLGNVGTSSPRIVRALIAAYESHSYPVSRAAAKSLRAPVNRDYAQQHPDLLKTVQTDLLEAVQRDVEPVPGVDSLEPIRSRGSKPAETYDRKKPVSRNLVLLSIPAGIVLLGIGVAGLSGITPKMNLACLNWICILAGVVLVGWALWAWLAPSSVLGVFRRTATEVVGTVAGLSREERLDDYGPEYKYFVTVRFKAEDPKMGTRVIQLEAQVAHYIWKRMKRGNTVGIQYAAEDPTIALIEGEW